MFERALSIREQALDPHHPLVAKILNNLAGIYFKQGNYNQAVAFFQRALDILKQAPDEYHSDLAIGQFNLAGVFAQQSKCGEAKDCYEQALITYEKVVGRDSPRLIPTLVAFASFLRKLYQDQPEMIQQAEKMEKRVREIQEPL